MYVLCKGDKDKDDKEYIKCCKLINKQNAALLVL